MQFRIPMSAPFFPIPVWILGLVWVLVCWPMLTGQWVVGFRDSTMLYYPLFQYIDQLWQAGQIPLWNHHCNYGAPLLADGSSSVMYPGKLVFLIRWLDFPTRYGWYLSLHLLWASWGTYTLGRKLGLGRPGATLAAISFAYGAPVLFQVTNVIYLVSASWLPWALKYVWQMQQSRNFRNSLLAGVACSQMILGGDPQMTMHVGLIALATTLATCLRSLRASRQSPPGNPNARSFWSPWLQLVVMTVVAGGLAAVQILPTAVLAKQSERSGVGQVVNVYSALDSWIQPKKYARDPLAPGVRGLLEREDQIVGQYQFSQPPWLFGELLFPNVSGSAFPQHARWVDFLPGAERMWYPSLYVGAWIPWLALFQFRLWGKQIHPRQKWLSWILLIFGLGSLGWYGAVWLLGELTLWSGGRIGDPWSPPVGGVYWWLSCCVPKYFAFRYPAKLWVVATLALSLLAGSRIGPKWRLPDWKFGAGFLLLATSFWILLEGWGSSWMNTLVEAQQASPESLPGAEFGPFRADLAVHQVRQALLQATVVVWAAIVGGWLVGRSAWRRRHLAAWCLVGLTTIDVLIANPRWCGFVKSTLVTRPMALDIAEAHRVPANAEPTSHWLVPRQSQPTWQWSESSPNRMAENIAWAQSSGQPKWHLPRDFTGLGSFQSIWPQAYERRMWEETNAWQLLGSSADWTDRVPQADSVVKIFRMDSAGQLRLIDPAKAQQQLGAAAPAIIGFACDTRVKTLARDGSSIRVALQAPAEDGEWIALPLWTDGNWHPTSSQVAIRTSPDGLLQIRPPRGAREVQLRYDGSTFWWGLTLSLLTCSIVIWRLAIVPRGTGSPSFDRRQAGPQTRATDQVEAGDGLPGS